MFFFNRYSVVTYGGAPPFDRPRSIVHNNKVFTNLIDLKYYFDHIRTSSGGSNDTFEAISLASKLIFRPGASKTFILMPCSTCASSEMRVCFTISLSFKSIINDAYFRFSLIIHQFFK